MSNATGKERRPIFHDLCQRIAEGYDHRTHFDLGVAYAAMGLLDDAIGEFEAVLRAAPGDVEARAKLEEALLRRRRAR
jgi:tetratricopeptide (TPR) repeat protein